MHPLLLRQLGPQLLTFLTQPVALLVQLVNLLKQLQVLLDQHVDRPLERADLLDGVAWIEVGDEGSVRGGRGLDDRDLEWAFC